MKDITRTLVFAAIAVALSAITFFTRPSAELLSPADMVGQSLFPQFEDPMKATGLEIVKYDQETASPVSFTVKKEGNSWVIPPKNYPADAEDQLAEAAADLVGLEVLGVAADPEEVGVGTDDIRGLHRTYGVIDPSEESASDAEGVGTRVAMRDSGDAKLVELIIGKEVEGQDGLRYVRRVGQDPVYTVKIGTDKFSTKFEDWIEDDLLKLNSWDIRNVEIDDYSIDMLQGTLKPRAKISLRYNDTGDPRWTMPTCQVMKSGWVDQELAENEELDTDTLNELKNALDDLKIIDVERKPEGVGETLIASESFDPQSSRTVSLGGGFYIASLPDPADPSRLSMQVCSNEGEISVSMKDGVKYLLRFGGIAGMASGDESEEEETAEDKEGDASEEEDQGGEEKEESSTSDVNRYLFVMAQLDPGMIDEPDYEELPELPAEDETDEKADSGDAVEEKPETEEKPADKKPAGEKTTDEESGGEEEAAEEKPADSEGDKAAESEESEPEEPKPTREEIEKKREEIQKENDRKKEDYEKKIKEAEDKVKELNARFAEWYYVIDDSEYQKIHLNREKIVKEKEEEEEEDSDEAGTDSEKPAVEPDSMGEFEDLKLDAPSQE